MEVGNSAESLPEARTATINIGITGKRDLQGHEHALRPLLACLFRALAGGCAGSTPRLITGLAEGADLVATEVALNETNWPIEGMLAFSATGFLRGFDQVWRQRYDAVVASPRCRLATMPPLSPIAQDSGSRGPEYEQFGLWLTAQSDILIAIMPAEEKPGRLGGTARVLHHRIEGAPDSAALDVLARSTLPLESLLPRHRSACVVDLPAAGSSNMPRLLSRDASGQAPLATSAKALRAAFPDAGWLPPGTQY